MPHAHAVIKRDHRAVKIEYKNYKAARTANEKSRIVTKILASLEAHVRMEEELFYPMVREEGSAKVRTLIETAYAEHEEIKMQIKRLRSERGDLGFGMKLDELMAGVLHHVKEEEHELLPEIEKSVNGEDLETLGTRMDAVSPSRGERPARQLAKRIGAEARALVR